MTDAAQSDLTIVVVSNDGYADVWPGFFTLLFRFWPDRPYKLYLISNSATYPDDRVIPIHVGDDRSWSRTLARGLERVPSRHVLLMLEDYYLAGPADSAKVGALYDAMIERGAVYLRLYGAPNPDIPDPIWPQIGAIKKGAAYRTSLQTAFWDRQVLLDLLREEESAWQFELQGSRRSDRLAAPFLSVYNGVFPLPYRQAVRRGQYMADSIAFFTALGMTFDFSRRPVESKWSLWLQASNVRRILGRVKRFFFGPRLSGPADR